MLCLGIIIIACAMIVEQVEENHQIEWQRNKLQIDLDYFNKQVDINQQFLERLATDANLAERLAQRQMKLVRQGSAVLELTDPNLPEDTSPFRLVNITPPPPVQPYEPARGPLTTIFGNTRLRLYIFGLGLCLMAIGLIVGGSEGKTRGAM